MPKIQIQTRDGPRPINIPVKTIFIVIGIVILLVIIASSIYTIEANELGVVQRFGRFDRLSDPGLNFKLPWGLESVTPVRVNYFFKEEFGFRTQEAGIVTSYDRTRPIYDDEARMLTGDLNIATVNWTVQYTIKDPAAYLFNVRDPKKTLRDMSESIMREVVGDRSVTEALTEGRKDIIDEVRRQLQVVLNTYNSGINVNNVILKSVSPPMEVKDSFNEVNQAQQEMDKTVNQALEDYNKVIPRAKGQALKTINEAEGYKEERINRATGDVARFKNILVEYRKAPDITRRRIYLETMQKILPRIQSKVIIDEEARSVLPFLNLRREGGLK